MQAEENRNPYKLNDLLTIQYSLLLNDDYDNTFPVYNN